MCVLSGKEIERRAPYIFNPGSWCSKSLQEASYDLRVDSGPYMRIGGVVYDPDHPYKGDYITIKPGEMAMLPTVESFNMPPDLIGSIKLKFNQSRKGLTPLFGPKIDPYFGKNQDDERLYLWVSNLGLKDIDIDINERVFTVEFHRIFGDMPKFEEKDPIGTIVAKEARKMGSKQNLGFMDTMKKEVTRDIDSRLSSVEQGTTQVVQFGVFLVASTLLAGFIAALFAMIFALNTDSGVKTVQALEGSSLGVMLLIMCVLVAVTLVLFILAFFIKIYKRL